MIGEKGTARRFRSAARPLLAPILVSAALAALLWWLPPAGDDAYAHAVYGLEELRCWQAGDLFPRLHTGWNGGTGSFVATVYAPLVLGLNGALCWITGEGTRALGLSLALALLAACVAIRGAGSGGEIRGAWLWALAPYPLAAVLARATATEVWALAAAAGVLLLAAPPGPETRGRGLTLAVLVAVTSGCQLAMLVLLAWVLPAAWLAAGLRGRVKACLRCIGWCSGGLLLGGVLWWPTVADMGHLAREELITGQYSWQDHFVLPPGGNLELGSVLLVAAASIAAVAALALLGRSVQAGTRRRAMVAVVAVSLFMALPLSAPLWRLPFMAGLQFPWRFLGPATLAAVVLVGCIPARGRRLAAAAILVLPSVLIPVELDSGEPSLRPGMDAAELAKRCAVRYGLAPILPSMPGLYSAGFHPLRSLGALQGKERELTVEGLAPLQRTIHVGEGRAQAVLLPLQHWPEWRVEEGGRPLEHRNRLGLVEVEVGEGERVLEVRAGPSRSRRFGLVLSVVGVVALAATVVVGRRRESLSRPSSSAGQGSLEKGGQESRA